MATTTPLPPPISTSAAAPSSFNSFNQFPPTPDYDDVESPSLTSGNALARFEFEKPGSRDSRDGTKVLMVEWEDDAVTSQVCGDWTVSWEGKRAATLSAKDVEGNRDGLHRLYFLLPAGERVPGTVSLTLEGVSDKGTERIVWRTNPLPAIFPPELGASARAAGKKGVLHTVWAKKRLQVLRLEIDAESNRNAEGIALQMAIQEREWIEQNFGVNTRPANISIPSSNGSLSFTDIGSPVSPRSPGRGPLLEKLKGLKLGTSEKYLSGPGSDAASKEQNPLSPEGSDVAVSSFERFASLNGLPDPSTLASKPAQQTQSRIMVPQRPPEEILAQQRQSGMGSLNAFAGLPPDDFHRGTPPKISSDGVDEDVEDDLFALPISPRSPDQGRTRFTFANEDTSRYLQRERA